MNKIITFLVAMAISLTAMAQVAQEREDSTRKFNPGHITSTYGYSYTYDGSGNRVGLKDSLETSLPGPIIPPILNNELGRSESSDSTLLIEQRLRVQALIAAEARLTDSLKAQVSFRSNYTRMSDEERSHYAVGRIPVIESISPSGARTYRLNIPVASGYKFTPSVSLVYNSQMTREGAAGFGWTIDGISTITLIHRTQYHHGGEVPADVYGNNQAYALDGCPFQSNTIEGLIGEYEYETEVGNIVAKRNYDSGGNLTHFTVLYPNGVRAVYGNPETNGPEIEYPVTEMEDALGNKIRYSYIAHSGTTPQSYLVSSICYGFDSNGNASGRIDLGYTADQTVVPRFFAGGLISVQKRLTSIESKDSLSRIVRYELDYREKENTSLLSKIRCYSQTDSLPPAQFAYYEKDNPDLSDHIESVDSLLLTSYYQSLSSCVVLRGKFAECTNDDGLIIYPKTGTDRTILVAPRLKSNTVVGEISTNTLFLMAGAADADGDGVDEIVTISRKSSNPSYSSIDKYVIKVYSARGGGQNPSLVRSFELWLPKDTSSSYADRTFVFGDFDADGIDELLSATISSNSSTMSRVVISNLFDGAYETSSTPFALMTSSLPGFFVQDIESDGRAEVCIIDDARTSMNVYAVTGSDFGLLKTITGLNSGCLDEGRPLVGDFNGDGLMDLLTVSSHIHNMTHIAILTLSSYQGSSSFSFSSVSINGLNIHSHEIMIGDANGDGVSEIFATYGSLLKTIYYTGPSSVTYCVDSISSGSNMVAAKAGRSYYGDNLLAFSGATVKVYSSLRDIGYRRLLEWYEDGFGNLTQSSYSRLSDNDDVYTFDGNRTYGSGFMKIAAPIPVLSEESTSGNGLSEIKSKIYRYKDAVWFHGGGGFCGFGWMSVSDVRTRERTVIRNNPILFGVPEFAATLAMDSQDDTISIRNYNFSYRTTTHGQRIPYLVSETESDYLKGVSESVYYEYDSFDLVTERSIELQRLGSEEIHSYEITDNTYTHSVNPGFYCVGGVASKSLKKWRYGGMWSVQHEDTFVLDTLLRPIHKTTVIRQRDHANHVTSYGVLSRDSLRYDNHGNLIRHAWINNGSDSYLVETNYYDSTGRYLLETIDPMGHSSFFGQRNIFGHPLSTTDYKGRTTNYLYDSFGNQTVVTRPDGTIGAETRTWGGDGIYSIITDNTGVPHIRRDFDAFGREISSRERRFDGVDLVSRKKYNYFGRLSIKYLPRRADATTDSLYTYYLYDDFGRLASEVQPSGGSIGYQYDTTCVTTTIGSMVRKKIYGVDGLLEKATDSGGDITYVYTSDGLLKKVEAPGSNPSSPLVAETSIEYDSLRRRSSILDSALGEISFTYRNRPGGTILSSRNTPTGSTITEYDKFGRKISECYNPILWKNYSYNDDGLLVREFIGNSSRTYIYDTLDRVISVTDTIPEGKWLRKDYTYASGKISSISYTSNTGYITTESYQWQNGHNVGITLPGGMPVFSLTSENELGIPDRIMTGSIYREYEYDSYGYPSSRTMGSVMDLSYTFDPLRGNLLSRSIPGSVSNKSATYDNTDRLASYGGTSTQYDVYGNLKKYGTDCDLKFEDSTNPYAATWNTLLPPTLFPNRQQTIAYTNFSRPSRIVEGDIMASFVYGVDLNRVKMTVSNQLSTTLERYYIGDRYEVDTTSTGTVERLYLGGDAYSAPMVYYRNSSEGNTWRALNIGRDYQGSITNVAESNGTALAECYYDAWGTKTKGHGTYNDNEWPQYYLGRGYSGHEELPWFGLINMNARLYDPSIGRFLSPDPYISAPGYSQGLNRYAYALNNPFKYSDESGEFVFTTAVIACVIVGAVFGAYIGGVIANDGNLNPVKWNYASDSTWGYMVGGFMLGGVSGFFGGYAAEAAAASIGTGGAIGGAYAGAAAGLTSGSIQGFGFTFMAGGDIDDALSGAAIGGISGMVSGALIGGLTGGISAAIHGKDFMTGYDPELGPYQKGLEGVRRAEEMILSEGNSVRGNEVTVEVNGTRVKVDKVADIGNEKVLIEVKNGLNAGFTKNQSIVYPQLSDSPVFYPGGESLSSFVAGQPTINTPVVPYGSNAATAFGPSAVGTEMSDVKFVIIKF